jgi:hypothetical protein
VGARLCAARAQRGEDFRLTVLLTRPLSSRL